MSVPGGIRVKLALALLGIVGGALLAAYAIVVPSLELRLVDAKLNQLQTDAEALAVNYALNQQPLDNFVDGSAFVSDARVVELTPREFDMLELFLTHPRQVFPRDVILNRVWGYDFSGESNILEVYIRYLRSKLDAVGSPKYIQTVRGIGYVLREEAPGNSPEN